MKIIMSTSLICISSSCRCKQAVFLNVVSGMTVTETAGDLAIAAAICSRFMF